MSSLHTFHTIRNKYGRWHIQKLDDLTLCGKDIGYAAIGWSGGGLHKVDVFIDKYDKSYDEMPHCKTCWDIMAKATAPTVVEVNLTVPAVTVWRRKYQPTKWHINTNSVSVPLMIYSYCGSLVAHEDQLISTHSATCWGDICKTCLKLYNSASVTVHPSGWIIGPGPATPSTKTEEDPNIYTGSEYPKYYDDEEYVEPAYELDKPEYDYPTITLDCSDAYKCSSCGRPKPTSVDLSFLDSVVLKYVNPEDRPLPEPAPKRRKFRLE